MGASNGKKIVNLRKSVKSFFIIENIFSFLKEKKKLSLIIYNKKYQDNFKIGIDYYKKISGKYLVGERNGRGKEYLEDTNTLVFEGEYLNGKRNGKGKEYYDNGKIKFEGEYLKGKIICGKKFDEEEGKVILSIEKNGKGKEYNYDGDVVFKGKYINGKRNGKGKECGYAYRRYEGEFLEGERNGKGKEYDREGKLVFEGNYLNGKKNGKGKGKIVKEVMMNSLKENI